MIKFQRLTDSVPFVHLIKLKTNLTFLYMYIDKKYSILKNKFYEKIELMITTFEQLSSLQAISEHDFFKSLY